MTSLTTVPCFWEEIEPNNADEGGGGRGPHSCDSKQLKTDLAPGTFVIVLVVVSDDHSNNSGKHDIIARIVRAVRGLSSLSVEVNEFKKSSEEVAGQEQREHHC